MKLSSCAYNLTFGSQLSTECMPHLETVGVSFKFVRDANKIIYLPQAGVEKIGVHSPTEILNYRVATVEKFSPLFKTRKKTLNKY